MTTLRIAAFVPVTAVEGPGRRAALWVQGCTLACPGCCNPEMFSPRGGIARDVAQLAADVRRAHTVHGLEGLTVLGGEPLQQLDGVAALCRSVAADGLGIIVFTGYTRAEAEARPGFAALWGAIDTLVAGRFDRTRPEPEGARRFVGSSNQTLEHRTPRYAAPSHWTGPCGAEVHLDGDGGLRVIGAPRAAAPLLTALRRAGCGPLR